MRSRRGLLLIYQATYCRNTRTHFAFSLSDVQMKACELTSCDLNICTGALCPRVYACASRIQLDKCVRGKSGNATTLGRDQHGYLNVWLLVRQDDASLANTIPDTRKTPADFLRTTFFLE